MYVELDVVGLGREPGDRLPCEPLQICQQPVPRGVDALRTDRQGGRKTHDEVPELSRAVVDLDVARLGRVRDAGDVHGLLARGDGERDRLARRGLLARARLDAATDGEAVEVEADVCARGHGLGDRRGAAQGDGDVFRCAAAAVGNRTCQDGRAQSNTA